MVSPHVSFAQRPIRAEARPALADAHRGHAGLRVRALVLVLLAVVLLARVPTALAVEPPPPPFVAAVLDFGDRRTGGAEQWLGRYLQERLGILLARAPQVATLEPGTARLWADTLALGRDAQPTPAQLDRMGAQVAVRGTTQTVLGLVEVRLRISTADGLLPVVPVRTLLAETPPADLLQALLETLHATLKLPPPDTLPDSDVDWPAVERLYTALLDTPPTGLMDGRWRARVEAEARPGAPLRARALEALAEADLRAAMLGADPGGARRELLQQALKRITAAIAAEPEAQRHALRGELYHFLKDPFQAKTDASVARLKNPRNALAYTVLGLVAGLSTGQASEHLEHALTLNPFLWSQRRPEGAPPYQAGVLEPYFDRWAALRAERVSAARGPQAYEAQLQQGIGLYEQGDYEDAARVLGDAAAASPDDPRAELYLQRILLDTGRADEAVSGLQGLLERYPNDPVLLYWFGRALETTGALVPAHEAYRQAAAESPEDPAPRRGLARVALAQGQPQDAAQQAEALLQDHPDDAEGWLLAGRAYLALEQWGDAETAMRKALALQPDLEAAREGLQQAAAKGGQ